MLFASTPWRLQARHEMLEDVAVAEAAVAGQHHLQEDVLRKEDGIEIPVGDEARQSGGVLLVAGRLGLLVGIEEVHADHVVFEKGAAVGDAPLIGEVAEARIHVTENRVPKVAAFRLDHVEDAMTVPLPAGRWIDRGTPEYAARPARRRAAPSPPRR